MLQWEPGFWPGEIGTIGLLGIPDSARLQWEPGFWPGEMLQRREVVGQEPLLQWEPGFWPGEMLPGSSKP